MAINQVLDLFCGAGGLSYGFASGKFDLTPVDVNPWSGRVFEENGLGRVLNRDLTTEVVNGGYDAVVGGSALPTVVVYQHDPSGSSAPRLSAA